jgi:O-antigen/teichoic acid export membrane protein
MLPEKEDDAATALGVSVLSVALISLLVAVLGCIFSDYLLGLLKSPESGWLLWVLPLGLFVNGLNQSFQSWCIRRKAFKRTASSQIIRTGGVNIFQIISGLIGFGGGALINGVIVGNAISTINLARQAFYKDKFLMKTSIAWKKIIRVAYEYRDFPFFCAPQNIMNALSQDLPTILLSYFYDIGVAGAYAFGIRVVKVPFNFVLTAFRQVMFQKASEAHNQGQRIYPLFLKTTLGLASVAIPPSVLLVFFAPVIFAWIFGEQWRVAGEYAGWLVLWLMVGFCNVPSVLFGRILRKQKGLFIYGIVQLLSRVIILVVGGLYLKAQTTIVLFSITGIATNLVLIFWMGSVIKSASLDTV